MSEPTLFAAPATQAAATPATRDHCGNCNAAIIRTWDDPDALGLPVTLNAQPTTPTAALAAIVTSGATVCYSTSYKRDRGAGVGKDFRYWRPAQYAVDFAKPLHVEHHCGAIHPPLPPTPPMAWPDDTTPPPF